MRKNIDEHVIEVAVEAAKCEERARCVSLLRAEADQMSGFYAEVLKVVAVSIELDRPGTVRARLVFRADQQSDYIGPNGNGLPICCDNLAETKALEISKSAVAHMIEVALAGGDVVGSSEMFLYDKVLASFNELLKTHAPWHDEHTSPPSPRCGT